MNRKGLLLDRLYDLFPYEIHDRKTKRSYEFDVVGETKKGLINYECKYKDAPIAPKEIYEEKRQMELCGEQFLKTVFLSKSPVLDDSIERYGLSDFFSAKLQ